MNLKTFTTWAGLLMAVHPLLGAQSLTSTVPIRQSGGGNSVTDSAVVYFVEFDELGSSHPIFDTLPLTLDDVGRVFTFNQNDDPDFSSIAALLTDGKNERVGVGVNAGGGGGVGYLESSFFPQLPTPG